MAYYRTGTNDFSSIQYTNLTAENVKKNVTVTVKDPNDNILKSVTGTYEIPVQKLKGHRISTSGSWSGSNFIVYIYYDGSLVASKTYSQYETGQLGMKSNSSPITSGGYSLTGGRYISGDYQRINFWLNGSEIGSTPSVSFYANVPSYTFTIP